MPYARDRLSALVGAIDQRLQVVAGLANVSAPDLVEPANKPSENDCCCGGPLCHGGIPAAATLEGVQYLSSDNILPASSFALAWRLAFGIERPPR